MFGAALRNGAAVCRSEAFTRRPCGAKALRKQLFTYFCVWYIESLAGLVGAYAWEGQPESALRRRLPQVRKISCSFETPGQSFLFDDAFHN